MDRRRLTLSTSITAVLALGLLAGGSAPASGATARPAGANLVPARGVLFGAYVQPSGGESSDAAVAGLESTMDRKLDLVRIYRTWDDPQPAPAVLAAVRRGQIPVLSIRARTKDGRVVPWASIARGDTDTMIAKQADGLRSLAPAKLFLSFHHEPDASGSEFGTPADYVAAWRHYWQVFTARGVTNVAFVWIMTPWSFKSGAADSYYPGDGVLDWIAEDAYNWFGCSPGMSTVWRSPGDMVAPMAGWAEPHGKPLMLAEWGSVEDPAQPGRKAEWLRDGLDAARSWPQLRALSYFDAVGTCDWRLRSGSAQQAFAEDGDDSLAHARPSAFLQPSTLLGVAPLTVHFDGSDSAGTGSATGAGVLSWTLDFGDGSSTSGTGQPPADIAHSYRAGTFAARLRVTDATGAANQDERSIVAAAPPVISGEVRDVTDTSATVNAWVAPQGLAATAVAEWGSTVAYGSRTPAVQIPATTGTAALAFPLSGLTPGTRYYARVSATNAAGTRVKTWTFDTPGPPTTTTGAAWAGSTSATLSGYVNPHALATDYRFEWGRSTSYGNRTSWTSLDPVTWNVYVRAALTGLDQDRTYHFRLVASNSAGTSDGPDQVVSTG